MEKLQIETDAWPIPEAILRNLQELADNPAMPHMQREGSSRLPHETLSREKIERLIEYYRANAAGKPRRKKQNLDTLPDIECLDDILRQYYSGLLNLTWRVNVLQKPILPHIQEAYRVLEETAQLWAADIKEKEGSAHPSKLKPLPENFLSEIKKDRKDASCMPDEIVASFQKLADHPLTKHLEISEKDEDGFSLSVPVTSYARQTLRQLPNYTRDYTHLAEKLNNDLTYYRIGLRNLVKGIAKGTSPLHLQPEVDDMYQQLIAATHLLYDFSRSKGKWEQYALSGQHQGLTDDAAWAHRLMTDDRKGVLAKMLYKHPEAGGGLRLPLRKALRVGRPLPEDAVYDPDTGDWIAEKDRRRRGTKFKRELPPTANYHPRTGEYLHGDAPPAATASAAPQEHDSVPTALAPEKIKGLAGDRSEGKPAIAAEKTPEESAVPKISFSVPALSSGMKAVDMTQAILDAFWEKHPNHKGEVTLEVPDSLTNDADIAALLTAVPAAEKLIAKGSRGKPKEEAREALKAPPIAPREKIAPRYQREAEGGPQMEID